MPRYIITWSMIYEAESMMDAVEQAVGELQDPEITCTILWVDLPNGQRVAVEARPVFRGQKVEQLEMVERREHP